MVQGPETAALLRSDLMTQKEQDSKNVENFLLALTGEAETRAARVRKVGNWCWLCGTQDTLSKCGCPMPESLQCLGQRVCKDCSAAHRAIADHLKRLFAAPRVDRSSSVRGKLFSQLHGAADELNEQNPVPLEQSLHFHLAQADPFEDEKPAFKGMIAAAFERSKFSDFQGLARELEKEADMELKYRMARYFSSCAM
jgi:hypothetical protein